LSLIGFLAYPERSHLWATFGIAKALKSRGHEVRYLAPLDFREVIANQGFDFIPLCEDILPIGSFGMTRGLFVNRMAEFKLFEVICRGELDGVIKRAQMELLVVDSYAQHMALIGYKLGIPTLLLSPTLPRARDAWVPPVTEALVPKSPFTRLRVRLSWCVYDLFRLYRWTKNPEDWFRRIVHSSNYPLSEIDMRGFFPVLKLIPELILCPEAFDLPRARALNFLHYVGAYTDLRREESSEFPWDKLKVGKALIYCAFGTLSHRFSESQRFLQMVIDAVAARQDLQLVVSIGAHLTKGDFSITSSNVVVVNRAPQIEVLRRANAMITHGGLNSVKECIMLGVPMIVFPWSKPVNAVRVAYHGLGLMGDVKKASVRQIQRMIDRVLKDPSFRTRTASMREKFIEVDRRDLGIRAMELVLDARSTSVLMKRSSASRSASGSSKTSRNVS
jgi:zeaxanthin glucosyltransferase